MKLHIKRMFAVLLGLQASYALAASSEAAPQQYRFVENLSADERAELKNYLQDLQSQGYKVDLKKKVIVIDRDNRVFLLPKNEQLLQQMRSVEEPSCMSGGTTAAKQ